MKCLITGGTGFLGQRLAARLSRDYETVAQGYRHGDQRTLMVDLRNPDDVRGFLKKSRPDIIVHCAAYRDPDFCEQNREETLLLNLRPVELISAECSPDIPLVFISSDYVFDGHNPPYRETSRRNPINVYGRSKMAAEDILVTAPTGHCFKNSPINRRGPDLGNIEFYRQNGRYHQETASGSIDNAATRFPVWTDDVAEVIAFLLARNVSGIFHYGGTQGRTKYHWAMEIAELLGASAEHITPLAEDTKTKAARPLNTQLICPRIQETGYTRFTVFADVVKQVLASMC